MNQEFEKAISRRCPRLGGPVSFHYCRCSGSTDDPCHKIFDCWWEMFDVAAYLRDTLPPQQFQRICRAAPPSKVAKLVELAQRDPSDQQGS